MRRAMCSLAFAALLLGACAGDGGPDAEEDPRGALMSGLESLEATEGQTITFTLESTPEDLTALAADDGDALSSEDAQKILDSSLQISGKSAENPEDAESEIVVNVAGSDAVEMRVVGETLYARADIGYLVETFNAPEATLDQIEGQAQATGLPYLQAAVNGEWIGIENFDALQENLGGAAPSPSAEDKRLIEQFTSSLKDNVEVSSVGSDDAGDHLEVRAPLRETYQDFIDLAQGSATQLPPGQLPDAGTLPDEDIVIDAWVQDNRLSQIEFDLLQIQELSDDADIPKGVDQFSFRMTIDEFTETVEPPEGAETVTADKLIGDLMGGATLGQ